MYECKIAEKLVKLRTSKGITQDDVAKSLSVSNKTISKWETGASMPDISMLAELAKYYDVTADMLLGLSDYKKQTTAEAIHSMFKGLNRRESVLKAFEITRSLSPAMYESMLEHCNDKENNFPAGMKSGYRSELSSSEFFEFSASSENVNFVMLLLRNEADFAWMNDVSKQKEIVKLFRLLSCEDVLSVLYYVHSLNCSDNFTADYIADNTGIKEERASEILDELCSVGACSSVIAHITEGKVKVYECCGDGIILSLITIAFEKMCGRKSYDYCFNDGCKMIGGK